MHFDFGESYSVLSVRELGKAQALKYVIVYLCLRSTLQNVAFNIRVCGSKVWNSVTLSFIHLCRRGWGTN